MAYNYLRTKVDQFREAVAPLRHTSNFRETGQLTPEEFVQAGDYLVYKFPSWSWSDAASPSKRVAHFPDGKQFLVTRGVPCRRRLGGSNAHNNLVEGDQQLKDVLIKGEDGEDWLSAGDVIQGGGAGNEASRAKEVKSLDDSDKLGDVVGDDDDNIPDMEDYDEEDDDAIIRDKPQLDDSFRTYNLYIMYSQYYRTPRLYLSGYTPTGGPLPPEKMMDDIVGDYTDKTVTLEPFPFVDSGLRMASVHPCRHAAVMKVLLDRADAALKLRVAKLKEGKGKETDLVTGLEGLEISHKGKTPTMGSSGSADKGGEEWEVLDEQPEGDDDGSAIRVDQYLVVFLKFIASVTPGIEHDFTMGV